MLLSKKTATEDNAFVMTMGQQGYQYGFSSYNNTFGEVEGNVQHEGKAVTLIMLCLYSSFLDFAFNIEGVTSGSYNDLKNKPTIPAAITVDAELSDTSTNPVQNKVVKTNMDALYNDVISRLSVYRSEIPTKVSDLENDAGYLTQHQSLDGYVKSVNGVTPNVAGDVTIAVGGGVSTDTTNTWTVKQTFSDIDVEFEYYKTEFQGSSSATPTESVLFCQTLGNFTLNLSNIVSKIPNGRSTVFSAYLSCFSDGVLTITNAGTLYYVGNASDLALTGTGLLVNILIIKNTSGAVDSIVQASKLEGGA